MTENLLSTNIADFSSAAKTSFAIGNPNNLSGQYTLTNISDLSYFVSKHLEVIHAYDSLNNHLGFFIGHIIDTKRAKMVHEKIVFCNEFDSEAIDIFIEKNVYSFSGSFIFILAVGNTKRLYLDACGSLPAVFDPEKQLAGGTSTALLTKSEYEKRFNKLLYDTLNIKKDGWFPGSLTAHSGIFRILPNHYLDMKTWNTQRHWPIKEFEENPNITDTITFIGQQVANQTKALIDDGAVTVALTGGADSRFILAANSGNLSHLSFTTLCTNSLDTSRDELIAADITRCFKLEHNLLPKIEASNEEKETWHLRTGHCMGGANMCFHPTTRPLSKYKYFLGGLGGEIGSSFFWRNSDTKTSKITSRDITIRLGMKLSPITLKNIEEWFKEVQHLNTHTILDLAYLELRMGSWAFAQSYTQRGTTELHPLISREIFEAMYTIPDKMRRGGKWKIFGIELLWKELLSIPVNSQGFFLDIYDLFKRGVVNPGLVLRKLRRKLF